MEYRSSLLPFETLVAVLNQNGFSDKLDTIMHIKSFDMMHAQQIDNNQITEEYRERLRDTWWEVLWPAKDTDNLTPQCRYLADSLRDAMRLRPGIDISLLADKSGSFVNYLMEIEDWEQDEEFAELFD
ncbi:MAG TPA: hypothetical protein PKB02_19365 [Anaerohalosphaeraceae bacterium]|nr:hypothetical protein [Anaerohalosphaeraceae bacterium]